MDRSSHGTALEVFRTQSHIVVRHRRPEDRATVVDENGIRIRRYDNTNNKRKVIRVYVRVGALAGGDAMPSPLLQFFR